LIEKRKPEWLKIKLPRGKQAVEVGHIVNTLRLHTICSSGRCPNQGECWACGTATFMIGGDICTRSCRFCNVTTGKPLPLDYDEPEHVAEAVQSLQLRHVALTSVDRDDLDDLGATHWARVIRVVKQRNPNTTIEALIPDFQGKTELIDIILEAKAEVVSHNMETVKRLSPLVRSSAKYSTSLEVIAHIAASGTIAKSGIMVGLGETKEEVMQTMDDLKNAGCNVMTIGQYLQPSKTNIEVTEYIHPDVFEEYRKIGMSKGFRHVESSPFVRSSYHSERHVK
jgi:lipoic acid synthetase